VRFDSESKEFRFLNTRGKVGVYAGQTVLLVPYHECGLSYRLQHSMMEQHVAENESSCRGM
jgi:hypothetical protein